MKLFSLRHRRAIILSLVIAAGLYLLAVVLAGQDHGLEILKRLSWQALVLLPACAFCSYLLRYARWQYFLARAGWKLPTRLHLAVYLAGFALTTTPGKAGETVRSILLRPHGIPYPTSLACFFSERLLDVIVVAMLASLSVYGLTREPGYILLVCAVALLPLPVIHSALLPLLITGLEKRLHAQWLRRFLTHLRQSLLDARIFLAWNPLGTGMLLGVIAWTLQGLAFWYLLVSLGFNTTIPLALGVYAVSLLAGAISMVPGGIGTTEASMALLLGVAGAPQQIALLAPVLTRLGTLWFAVGIGILASAWLGTRRELPQAT